MQVGARASTGFQPPKRRSIKGWRVKCKERSGADSTRAGSSVEQATGNMEAKMKILGGHIILLFLWVVVASALPETFLIGEKEQHCFYIHAEEKEQFKAQVFVFHGGSRDIVFTVSRSSSMQGRLL